MPHGCRAPRSYSESGSSVTDVWEVLGRHIAKWNLHKLLALEVKRRLSANDALREFQWSREPSSRGLR